MKRTMLIIAALLFGVTSLQAQEYDVLKNKNNVLLYSDKDGNWLTRKAWEREYGHDEFQKNFGNGTQHDHSQEYRFMREDILESIKLVGEGNVVWERVIESNTPIKELKLAALKRMANVIFESDDKIIGGVIEHGFIRDYKGRPWGIKHAHWKGIICYEFKEGRYKVTVSHIQYKAERGSSLGIYSLSLSTTKVYAPLANLLYPYGKRAANTRYYRLVDFLDYNFTTIFALFETEMTDNDW